MLEVREKYPYNIHSLCLMTNHFHLALETKQTELSKIMQLLLSIYAENYNKRHDCTGHLFEGRYTACLIEDERYFVEVTRYIHLNPVKAQMVLGPLDYAYSSYGLFVPGKTDKSRSAKGNKCKKLIRDLVETDRVLNCFGPDRKEQYRMFVEGTSSHTEQEQQIQREMKEDDLWLP